MRLRPAQSPANRRAVPTLLQAPDGPPNGRLYWGGPEGERVVTLLHGGDRRLLPLSCPVAPGVWAVFDQDAIADAAAGDLAMVSWAEGRGQRAGRGALAQAGEAAGPGAHSRRRGGSMRRAPSFGLCSLATGACAQHQSGGSPSDSAACHHRAPCTQDLAPLRFFEGACTWGPGELERQVEQGAWTCAAASRSLVLKHSSQLPLPLWQEVSELAAAGCCEAAGCDLALA